MFFKCFAGVLFSLCERCVTGRCLWLPNDALRRAVCFVQKRVFVKTIMLVDDSATLLLSVSTILAKAGYQVEKASDAQQGLKKFATGLKVDLLITDLNMPGLNGIEFIREVRKLPQYRFMPILFQTTESQQAKRLEAKAAGASGWLVKPVTATDLLNTIKLVMR